jgi:D-glycero-alpha-D-manno-heptose-7-phosphate kinase
VSRGVFTSAPCRVDLAGGTLDIWPLYLFHPGALTVNLAVDIQTTCRITPLAGRGIRLRSRDTGREENFTSLDGLRRAKTFRHPLAAHLVRFFAPAGGLEVETNSQSPAGAGISGSSALMIATTAALARFTGRRLSREQMRVVAQEVEAQLIRVPTGCQDYYPALYGGVSAIHLEPGGVRHEGLAVDLDELDDRLLLVYTGAPRQSGINNWEVFQAHINGDRRVFRNFEEIAAIARAMRSALAAAAWEEVARLLRAEWKLRKTNVPGITTPRIERLVEAARHAGARAAKVCGAGGGGCVVFLVEKDARAGVAEALRRNGGQILPFRVARHGLAYGKAPAAVPSHR